MNTIEERLYELELKEIKRVENQNKAVRKYLAKNPKKKLWYTARSNAVKRGVEFSISEDDIVIPTHCPIMGVELTIIFGEGRVNTNMSLDRIDSTKGYIPGNIQVISDLANRMKQNATPEELIAFAKGVLKTYDV